MRITPVHVQVGLTSLMGVLSLVLLFGTVFPQLGQIAQHQRQQESGLTNLSVPVLAQLPKVERSNPEQLEHVVFTPLKTTAQTSKIQVKTLESDVMKAEPISTLPPSVQKIPVSLKATGTYPELQAFQKKLMTLFPYMVLQEMNYELKPEAVAKAGISPSVEATWVFDLIISLS